MRHQRSTPDGRRKANGPDGEQAGEHTTGSCIHVGWQLDAPPQTSFLAPRTPLSNTREVAGLEARILTTKATHSRSDAAACCTLAAAETAQTLQRSGGRKS